MRKLTVSEFVSLDGVMQAPGGVDEDTEGGFAYGGWTGPYWHDDLGANFMQEMNNCDAFLLGRKTWQTHGEAFEPMPAGDPFGDVMNNMQKYVVSTTLKSAGAWRNSTLIRENVVEEIRKLKEQPGKDIYVDGSSVLVHTLARHDLVDEYSLLVFPVVLGSGKKVFPDGFHAGLKLVETKLFPTGVVLLRYQPDGNKHPLERNVNCNIPALRSLTNFKQERQNQARQIFIFIGSLSHTSLRCCVSRNVSVTRSIQ